MYFQLMLTSGYLCVDRHVTERAGLGKVTDFFSEVKHFDSEPGRFPHHLADDGIDDER